MKKKLVFVVLSTMLMLTACGKPPAVSGNGRGTEIQTQTETESNPPAETGTAEPESPKIPEPDVTGYYPGVFTQTGYESEYLGYRFTTPEGFTLKTQEELAALMGMSMDMISQDFSDAQMEYAKASIIYDLMASNAIGTNVNIVLQQLDTTGLTLDLLAETTMQQMAGLTSMECILSDSYEIVEFAGAEYAKYTATVTAQGVVMNQEYYVGMKPDRIVNFTFTYVDGEENQKDALVNAFSEMQAGSGSGQTGTQGTKSDGGQQANATGNATTGQKNALKAAKEYIDFSAFSYEGLIGQLEYEGYTREEAAYGADNCGADWYEQALAKAKEYLEFTAFSYEGLIGQLEYEEFTNEQAVYGADNCGADWNEQAAEQAKSYLEISSFSRSELISQLEYEGFTHEQAVYGAQANGY